MNNKISLFSLIIVAVVLLCYRYYYFQIKGENEFKITTWDAFGYYLYLPSCLIYKDYKELSWIDDIEQKYHLSGGKLYQANWHKTSGHYVFKYLGGVAIIQLPWFLIAHMIAGFTSYPQDGFSLPYQLILAFGMVFWSIFGIFVLRKLLLYYFNDITTALTLSLIILATNAIQYFSVDSGMSHVAIFPLYALVLYFTKKWHDHPKIVYAGIIGLLIGLATICRPTELVMLFIPLLWNTHHRDSTKQKCVLVKTNYKHLLVLMAFVFIGVLPQLLYWKSATGHWVYDVGSKWYFANPYFRVLFGFTNGWIIYTPVCLLCLIGFFFVKPFEFRKSYIWFGLLNLWIIMAWADWKYGATYSTRALVQTYPVYALGMAATIDRILISKWKYAFYFLCIYLVALNHFQLWQYNKTILHFRDMNYNYYKEIYWNANPSPEQYSLIDNHEFVVEDGTSSILIHKIESMIITPDSSANRRIAEIKIDPTNISSNAYFKVTAKIKVNSGLGETFMKAELAEGQGSKVSSIRLGRPLAIEGRFNDYGFYIKNTESKQLKTLNILMTGNERTPVEIKELIVTVITKK